MSPATCNMLWVVKNKNKDNMNNKNGTSNVVVEFRI